jgi:hypothetical protein
LFARSQAGDPTVPDISLRNLASSMPDPNPKPSVPKAPSSRTGKYCRRGAKGVPRTCQLCHQLKERHYFIAANGKRKFVKTGKDNCPRKPCPEQAGEGKCDKPECKCHVDDPDAVSAWIANYNA